MADDINTKNEVVDIINEFSSNQPSEQVMYEQYQELIERQRENDE